MTRGSGQLQSALTPIAAAIVGIATLTLPTTGAATHTPQEAYQAQYDLKKMGCKGDWNGSSGTDEAAAFQAAVAAAGALATAGNPVLLVAPPAAYRLPRIRSIGHQTSICGATVHRSFAMHKAILFAATAW